MAVKLNLLPEEFEVSGPVAAVLKIVRPLNITLLAIFLTAALGMAGFFVFSSITLKNLNTANSSLKNEIQAQHEAQQQAVLLKDRLEKIKQISTFPNASKSFTGITPFVDSLGANSVISELSLDSQKISLTANFRSNKDLTDFMKNLGSQSTFTGITLNSFNYNPATGYLVGIIFTGTGQN